MTTATRGRHITTARYKLFLKTAYMVVDEDKLQTTHNISQNTTMCRGHQFLHSVLTSFRIQGCLCSFQLGTETRHTSKVDKRARPLSLDGWSEVFQIHQITDAAVPLFFPYKTS